MPLIIMHASLCRFELLPLIDLGSSDKPKPLSKVSCGIPLIFSCFLLHVKKKKQLTHRQHSKYSIIGKSNSSCSKSCL